MISALEDIRLNQELEKQNLVHKFFNKPVMSDLLSEAIKEIVKI